jgi:GT2 family glycosyltransferase
VSRVGGRPRVSVIIPAYRSQATLVDCLDSLRAQSYTDFETILVDSSPDNETQTVVRGAYPWVIFEHSPERLLPHAARNRGATLARGALLVFTDPDVLLPQGWLARLVQTHQRTSCAIIGSVTCAGRGWLEVGEHFCKLDIWLPGGGEHPIAVGPTVNMLVPRNWYSAVGGFRPDIMLGDAVFCWSLTRAGRRLWFDPQAQLAHRHGTTWRELLAERFARGREFGQERRRWDNWNRGRVLMAALVSLLPMRLFNFVVRAGANAMRAGQVRDYILTLPVIVLGSSAWLAGELRSYGGALFGAAER